MLRYNAPDGDTVFGISAVKMAAPTVAVFDGWLSKRLLQINPDVDLEVFVSYIRSIVESEDDVEEATEALNGILAEIVVRV